MNESYAWAWGHVQETNDRIEISVHYNTKQQRGSVIIALLVVLFVSVPLFPINVAASLFVGIPALYWMWGGIVRGRRTATVTLDEVGLHVAMKGAPAPTLLVPFEDLLRVESQEAGGGRHKMVAFRCSAPTRPVEVLPYHDGVGAVATVVRLVTDRLALLRRAKPVTPSVVSPASPIEGGIGRLGSAYRSMLDRGLRVVVSYKTDPVWMQESSFAREHLGKYRRTSTPLADDGSGIGVGLSENTIVTAFEVERELDTPGATIIVLGTDVPFDTQCDLCSKLAKSLGRRHDRVYVGEYIYLSDDSWENVVARAWDGAADAPTLCCPSCGRQGEHEPRWPHFRTARIHCAEPGRR